MSKLRAEVKKLQELVIEETHSHIFCIPKTKKELNQILNKYKDENVTVEVLKIYDWFS